MNPTFENFEAECPHNGCGFYNIFNRATDLKSFNFITFKEVTCQKCGKAFNINCDQASNVYEYLIYDCVELLQQKKYMYVILNCCQAFEAFFALSLRNKFLYEPIDKEIISFDELNSLAKILRNNLSDLSFSKLRSIFIRINLFEELIDFLQIKEAIDSIGEKEFQNDPSDNLIKQLSNLELVKILIDIKNSDINSLRNKVVHQGAYRPTQKEAEIYLKTTRELIFGYRRISKFRFKTAFSLSPL